MLTKETEKKERPSPADSAQTPNVFLPPQYVMARFFHYGPSISEKMGKLCAY